MAAGMKSSLVMNGRTLSVEVLESLVRGYLVALQDPVAGEVGLEAGASVELVIGDTPAVPCTVAARESGGVRLLRGWGPPARRT